MALGISVEEICDSEQKGLVEQFSLCVEVVGIEFENRLYELGPAALLYHVLSLYQLALGFAGGELFFAAVVI